MANHSHKKRWPLVPPTIPSFQLPPGNDKPSAGLCSVLIREVTHERVRSTEDID